MKIALIIALGVIGIIFFLVKLHLKKDFNRYCKSAHTIQKDNSEYYDICVCNYDQMKVLFDNNYENIFIQSFFDANSISDVDSISDDYFILKRSESSDIFSSTFKTNVILLLDNIKSHNKFVKYFHEFQASQQDMKEKALLTNLLADTLEIAQERKTKAEQQLEEAINRTQDLTDKIAQNLAQLGELNGIR